MADAIAWIGTDDEQHAERQKACRARRKQYGQSSYETRDGSCPDCEHDMAVALRETARHEDPIAQTCNIADIPTSGATHAN